MLKVINSKVPDRIKIEIDYYLPFLLNIDEGYYSSLESFMWRISNSSYSLLEIYINPKNGALGKIKIPLIEGIERTCDRQQVEQIERAFCIHGIPVFDTSNLELGARETKPGYFKFSLNDEHLIIQLAKNISIAKVFEVDNLKFGVNIDDNLVSIACLNIYEVFNIPDLRKNIIYGNSFNTDKLTLVIDNQTNKNFYVKEEISKFLQDLCDIGICDFISNSEYFNYLISKEYYEVDDFVTEVFYLASISPERNLSLFRKAKEKFIDRFGDSYIG